MQHYRAHLLGALFITIAILVWLWSSSTLAPEPPAPSPAVEPIAAPPPPEPVTPPPSPAPEQAQPDVAAAAPEHEPPVLPPRAPAPQPPEAPGTSRPSQLPKAVVTGTVTVEGRPVSSLAVNAEVTAPDGTMHGVPGTTGRNGTYALQSPPGELRILFDVVDDTGARPTHGETLAVEAGRSYRLDYNFETPGSIRGQITGIASDEFAGLLVLLGEYMIEANAPEDIDALAEEADGEISVRGEGKYVLSNLEPGRYTVIAIARLIDEEQIQERNYEFRYVTGYVDVLPGQEAEFNVSLE